MNFRKKNHSNLSPEQRTERNRNLFLGVLSGMMLGFSFPPIPMPFLGFFAFIPYFFVLEKKETLSSINRFTYFTLLIFNLIALYWVGSWTKEADKFLMISGAALLFFNPLFYLIVSTLYYFSRKSFGKRIALFLFPFYWVSFEFLYSLTDLRFPWLTLGNSLPYLNHVIQIADIIGVYGLSLIILFMNVFLYMALKDFAVKKKVNWKYGNVALAIIIIVTTYGVIREDNFKFSDTKVKVGLIQPNLDPWDKWQEGNLDKQLNLYIDLSNRAIQQGAKLIIWPESALPVYLLSGNHEFEVARIRQFVSSQNIFLLTGMPDINFYFNKEEAPKDAKKTKNGYLYTSYNSILLFSPHNFDIQKYGKIKLVPFGEHVPFVEELPFLGDFIKWQVGISSWNVGTKQTVFNFDDLNNIHLKAAGVVCIESIYPEFVAGFVQEGANLIVVVTNDSWYGYSSGPFQHKEISVLRAVENRKTVVRAANGGISCIINPLGKTISETKLFAEDFLVGDVSIQYGLTFYSRYPYIFPLLSSFVSIVTILFFTYNKLPFRKKKKL